MGARWYDAQIGRWISPDTIIPDPANPQSFNRYAYVNNRPLVYIDPSGYDPLDAQWQAEFQEHHGRSPEWYDRLIRLFSIAFPEEWDWSAFYDSEGYVRDGFEEIFMNPGSSRSWANMSTILERLSNWYTKDEEVAFVRDVGTLFGGLYDRFDEPNMWEAIWTPPPVSDEHPWAYLNPYGMASIYLDDNPDSNARHWGWSFTLGYWQGPLPFFGTGLNAFREGMAAIIGNAGASSADVEIGTLGVNQGAWLRWRFVSFKKFGWGFGAEKPKYYLFFLMPYQVDPDVIDV
jgi:hypothetical protein